MMRDKISNLINQPVQSLSLGVDSIEDPSVRLVIVREIVRMIDPEGKISVSLLLSMGFDRQVGWTWMVKEKTPGKFRGTFPKRVGAFLAARSKEYSVNIKIPADALARIGELFRRNLGKSTTYHWDITDKFDWRRGAFGDGMSCFWSERRGALDVLRKNGVLAFRLFHPDFRVASFLSIGENPDAAARDAKKLAGLNDDEPIYSDSLRALYHATRAHRDTYIERQGMFSYARCWLAVDNPWKDAAIIFNCYPKNFRIEEMAQIVGTALGTKFMKKTEIRDNNHEDFIYVNGNVGVTLTYEKPITLSSVSFGFGKRLIGSCYICDVELYQDAYHAAYRTSDRQILVCGECENLVKVCPLCSFAFLSEHTEFSATNWVMIYGPWLAGAGKLSPSGNTFTFEVESTTYDVCASCAKVRTKKCERCGNVMATHTRPFAVIDPDNFPTWLCSDCLMSAFKEGEVRLITATLRKTETLKYERMASPRTLVFTQISTPKRKVKKKTTPVPIGRTYFTYEAVEANTAMPDAPPDAPEGDNDEQP